MVGVVLPDGYSDVATSLMPCDCDPDICTTFCGVIVHLERRRPLYTRDNKFWVEYTYITVDDDGMECFARNSKLDSVGPSLAAPAPQFLQIKKYLASCY